MKLKITKADDPLMGKTLNLIKKDDCLYICSDTGIEIIDAYDNEIQAMEDSDETEFFNLHIFSTSFGEKLVWIEEVKKLKTPKRRKRPC